MMLLYVAAALCSFLRREVVYAQTQSPSFYNPGDCQHPSAAVAEHQGPLNDEGIVIALLSLNEADVQVWDPDSAYLVKVTSPKAMEVLVGVNGGRIEDPGEGGEGAIDCNGQMWYTTAKKQSHTVLWQSPACCEIAGDQVQIFMTGSIRDEDFLRQQQDLLPGDVSECNCTEVDSSGLSPPVETPLPGEKAMEPGDSSGTLFTDSKEPDIDISGAGEIDPNEDAAGDNADEEESLTTHVPNKKSSFGYAFLVMLITIAIAWGAVWFYRKYRVQQMRNREFEGLEMRGYAQWSDAAGL